MAAFILAAVLLVAFLLIESSPRARWLIVISLTYILYHAMVTAAAAWTMPRYVISLSPFFAMMVAAALSNIWSEARDAWEGRLPGPLR